MVDIRKLWNNGMFQQLSNDAKLIYIYLSHNSSINHAGVVCISPENACVLLKMDINKFREATQELVVNKYVFVKSYENLIYFVIPAHFSTLATNDNVIEKIKSDIAGLPNGMKLFLNSVGISVEKKFKKFDKPTPEQVEKVGLEFGFAVNGKEFVDYYEDISQRQGKMTIWVDSNGTQIKDWKMKLKRVWCKPRNQLQRRTGAPRGFEFFFVEVDGKYVFPDSWKDGEPRSKDYSIQRALQKKFNDMK